MRFSVLVPVYNRPGLVRETIDSVLSQSFTDFELVLIDDGSTDSTPEVLKSYGNRIKILNQVNQGPEAARHRALSATSGEYFVLLDSDDLLFPNALETYDRVIRALDAPGVIIGSLWPFRTGEALPVTEGAAAVEVRQYENFFARDRGLDTTCSQIVARRDVVEAAGAFRSSATAFPFDTADILLSLSTHGPWVAVQQPLTIAYRTHSANTIGNLGYMLERAVKLMRLEKQGRYPGGAPLRFARRAYLGGVAWFWFLRAWRARLFGPASILFLHSAPMIARGLLRKVTQKFRPPNELIRLTTRGGLNT
jgi:glycosyltransferase involved in cell wall biosynthesis